MSKRITEAERLQMSQLYHTQKLSCEEIGRKMNRNAETVRNILKKTPDYRPHALSDSEKSRILELNLAGSNNPEISRILQRSPTCVALYLKSKGLRSTNPSGTHGNWRLREKEISDLNVFIAQGMTTQQIMKTQDRSRSCIVTRLRALGLKAPATPRHKKSQAEIAAQDQYLKAIDAIIRTCCICGKDKGLLSYWKSSKHSTERLIWCKECGKLSKAEKMKSPTFKEHYMQQIRLGHKNNKGSHRKSVQTANLNKRLDAIKLLGNVCERQGQNEVECFGEFHFHHRDGLGKLDPARRGGSEHARAVVKAGPAAKKKWALLCLRHHGIADAEMGLRGKPKSIERDDLVFIPKEQSNANPAK